MWQELLDGLQKTNSNFIKNQEASLSNSTQPAPSEHLSFAWIQISPCYPSSFPSRLALDWCSVLAFPCATTPSTHRESQAASAGTKSPAAPLQQGTVPGGSFNPLAFSFQAAIPVLPVAPEQAVGNVHMYTHTHTHIHVHMYGCTFEPGWFLCKRGTGKTIYSTSIYLMAYLGQAHFISREGKKPQMLPTDRRTRNISSGCQDAII